MPAEQTLARRRPPGNDPARVSPPWPPAEGDSPRRGPAEGDSPRLLSAGRDLPTRAERGTADPGAHHPPDLSSVLDAYGRRTRTALLARLDTAAPEVLNAVVREYPARAGKALRPAFVLLTAAALGGSEDAGMGLAVGVEMLHNAFLVHDDISDGSRLRRGGPSLPEQVGVGLSVCAGDALAVEALTVLQEAAHPLPGGPRCAG